MMTPILVERVETGIPGMIFERNVPVTNDRRPTGIGPDTTKLRSAEGAKVMVTGASPPFNANCPP